MHVEYGFPFSRNLPLIHSGIWRNRLILNILTAAQIMTAARSSPSGEWENPKTERERPSLPSLLHKIVSTFFAPPTCAQSRFHKALDAEVANEIGEMKGL